MAKYPKKIRTYSSLDTDFVGSDGEEPFDFDYTADKRFGRRLASFLLYRLVATPIAYLYCKLAIRQRIIGRRRLRGTRGAMLLLNHTEMLGDAFTPSLISFPRKAHVIVHADNLRLAVLGRSTAMLGAIPVPKDLRAARAFSLSVREKLLRGDAVAVYPEAHLWEKYIGIRPFNPTALDPAVTAGVPVFACTRVYKRSRIFGYVTRVYIDGPFYPDTSLSRSAASLALCEQLHRTMTARAAESDVEIIKYEYAADGEATATPEVKDEK